MPQGRDLLAEICGGRRVRTFPRAWRQELERVWRPTVTYEASGAAERAIIRVEALGHGGAIQGHQLPFVVLNSPVVSGDRR